MPRRHGELHGWHERRERHPTDKEFALRWHGQPDEGAIVGVSADHVCEDKRVPCEADCENVWDDGTQAIVATPMRRLVHEAHKHGQVLDADCYPHLLRPVNGVGVEGELGKATCVFIGVVEGQVGAPC